MDLRQLELFCAVVDKGDISKAAHASYCSQPVLSTQIQKLERELGHKLFDRSKRPMELTAAGSQVYTFAQSIGGMYRMLMEELNQNTQHVLRIGASTVPASQILPPVLATFHEDHPLIHYVVRQGDSARIAHMVAEGVLDFGVVGAVDKELPCSYTRLYDDHLVLAIPNQERFTKGGHGVKLEKRLSKLPFLSREQGSGTLKHAKILLNEVGIDYEELSIVGRFEDQDALCKSIAAGLGWSVLSELVSDSYTKTGQIIAKRLGDAGIRPIYIVTSKPWEEIEDEATRDCIAYLLHAHSQVE